MGWIKAQDGTFINMNAIVEMATRTSIQEICDADSDENTMERTFYSLDAVYSSANSRIVFSVENEKIFKSLYDEVERFLEHQDFANDFLDIRERIGFWCEFYFRQLQDKKGKNALSELKLSAHVRNALKRAGITTINSVVERTPKELLSIRNLGVSGLAELKEAVHSIGLSLKSEKADLR